MPDFIDFQKFLMEKWGNIHFDERYISDLNEIARFKTQSTENQHYVQQAYLNMFSNPNDKQWRIETLDLERRKIIKSQNSKWICSDNYFYGLETWKKDILSQILEWYLWKYENTFTDLERNLSKSILENPNAKIDEKDLYNLCCYISLTLMRTKSFRDELFNSDEEALRIFESENMEKDNLGHLQFLFNSQNVHWFWNILFNKKINIYYIKWLNREFVTSDNPVIQVFPEYEKSVYWIDFIRRIHYFPLNPYILFEFLPYKSGKKVKKILVQDTDKVMYYNLLRSTYSKYLYSTSKENFNQDEYTATRMNHTEELYRIFWNHANFDKDYEMLKQLKEVYKWVNFKNNYEMYKYFENQSMENLGI